MGRDAADILQNLQNASGVKGHSSMCWELAKILNEITYIFPAIESAQPGGKSGIQELCSLNNTIEKAKLLLQDCTESSKLYLTLNGEAALLRCERIRSSFYHTLTRLQDMVPVLLAHKIDEILTHTRDAKFAIAPAEREAGKVMLELLGHAASTKESELEAFRFACVKLNLTSSIAFLIERRSINKLLSKVQNAGSKKERILNYLLYLIKKYEKQVMADISELIENSAIQAERLCQAANSENLVGSSDQDETSTGLCSTDGPPEEFLCPISSKLMHDPVVIASGQTFERLSIEKWFREGNDACPKTQKKLENLSVVPNSCMKELIDNWRRKHGLLLQDSSKLAGLAELNSWETSHSSSISSLKNVSDLLLDGKTGDYVLQSDHSNISFSSPDASYCSDASHVKDIERSKDKSTQLFHWSNTYMKHSTFAKFKEELYTKFFYEITELPLETQPTTVLEFKSLVQSDREICSVMLSNGFIEALIGFLRDACNLSNVNTQKLGCDILLAFLSACRVDLGEEAYHVLASLLDLEIAKEVLVVILMLSRNESSVANIVHSGIFQSVQRYLDSKNGEVLDLSVKILCELSYHNGIRHHMVSCGCIEEVSPLLGNRRLAKNCIKIMRNLCDIEEAGVVIAKMNACIASIIGILELGSREEQEDAILILHTLCCGSFGNFQLMMDEGVIMPLVYISGNGSTKGKELAMKLLQVLRDHSHKILESQTEFNDTSDTAEVQSVSAHSKDCFSLPESELKQVKDYMDDTIKVTRLLQVP